MEELDLDLIVGDEESGEWFCSDCEYGPMDEEEAKCGRCGARHQNHKDEEAELDENGEPINEEYYEEHY